MFRVLMFDWILFRSVASWFDEEGTLLFDVLEKDVHELHNGIASEKKDKWTLTLSLLTKLVAEHQ